MTDDVSIRYYVGLYEWYDDEEPIKQWGPFRSKRKANRVAKRVERLESPTRYFASVTRVSSTPLHKAPSVAGTLLGDIGIALRAIGKGIGAWLALAAIMLAIVGVLWLLGVGRDGADCPPGQVYDIVGVTPAPGGPIERYGCVPE